MRDGFGLPLSGFPNSIPKRPLALLPNPEAGRRKPEADLDSRTFSPKTDGIRLGSSQNVNVVLFSLTCCKVSTSHKYFGLSHLHSGGWELGLRGAQGCGNLVESLAKSGCFGPPPARDCTP